MAILKTVLAVVLALACTGCFDAPVELVAAAQAVRVKGLEGRYAFMPDTQGQGMVAVGGGQVDLAWDDKAKSYWFDSVPRNPKLPKGVRSSDTVCKSLRLLPLDPGRGIYLAQLADPHYEERQAFWQSLAASPSAREKAMKDYGLTAAELDRAIPMELAKKPSHFLWLVSVDGTGTVLGGDDPDNTWVMAIKGFREALAAGDAERALELLRDNLRNLPPGFFQDRILVPAGKT